VREVAEETLKPLESGEVRLRVHGRQDYGSERVPASVFAQKLTVLVRGLRAADAARNGRVTHDYVISNLSLGSALVELREEEIRHSPFFPPASGVSAFDDCVGAIRDGREESIELFGKCPFYVSQLAKGSGNKFGYAELWTDRGSPVRVDEFLFEQAISLLEGPERRLRIEGREHWYKGVAQGRFEGEVKGVDLRGALPEVKLILTAGSKEIDCVFRDVEMERIREALDRRVTVEGTAFYDGRSGLPRRLEVTAINLVQPAGDFTRWKGGFEPFTAPEWESDDERE